MTDDRITQAPERLEADDIFSGDVKKVTEDALRICYIGHSIVSEQERLYYEYGKGPDERLNRDTAMPRDETFKFRPDGKVEVRGKSPQKSAGAIPSFLHRDEALKVFDEHLLLVAILTGRYVGFDPRTKQKSYADRVNAVNVKCRGEALSKRVSVYYPSHIGFPDEHGHCEIGRFTSLGLSEEQAAYMALRTAAELNLSREYLLELCAKMQEIREKGLIVNGVTKFARNDEAAATGITSGIAEIINRIK